MGIYPDFTKIYGVRVFEKLYTLGEGYREMFIFDSMEENCLEKLHSRFTWKTLIKTETIYRHHLHDDIIIHDEKIDKEELVKYCSLRVKSFKSYKHTIYVFIMASDTYHSELYQMWYPLLKENVNGEKLDDDLESIRKILQYDEPS